MIVFDHVSKSYPNGTLAVDGLSLEIPAGETLVLLGTSGCGKTTTLKMVNRLIEPSRGRISIDGQDILQQDPIQLRRGIGYVIQEIGLLPHMSVAENISVVPKLLKWPAEQIRKRVDELLQMVGLEPDSFRARYPRQLSGGQRQRVGVARALAADPPIILMDEPFGALDPITREQLQNEFIELLRRLKKTVIFVTHDIFEAIKMGTRIALLDGGRLQQIDSPAQLVERPANEFVHSFLGKHRFQLALMTTPVSAALAGHGFDAPVKGKFSAERLSASSSLLEALDIFQKTRRDELPVLERNAFLGYLKKGDLLNTVARILGEPEKQLHG